MAPKKTQELNSMGYTIHDIARVSGLSRSTVSRVINNDEHTSEKARVKVLKAIDELGYVPNLIARGLRSKPSIIGVITQDILNPYYIEALYEVEKMCKENGFALIHMNSDSNPEMEAENIYQLLSMKVQGIILMANMLDEHAAIIKQGVKNTHLVTMEGMIGGVDSVLSEPSQSITYMAQYLLDMGHRHFGLVHHDMRSFPIQERERYFLRALESCHVPYRISRFYGDDYQKQLSLAKDNQNLPTALFALNDSVALDLYRWCKNEQISIPQQLSIVGFDNVSTADLIIPTLTTIQQPIGKLAKIAMDILLDNIEKQTPLEFKQDAIKMKVQTKFIKRESTTVPCEFN